MTLHKKTWIAIIKWKPNSTDEDHKMIEGKIDYYGPFISYDTGVKLWTARFSNLHQGKFEHIDIQTLIKP